MIILSLIAAIIVGGIAGFLMALAEQNGFYLIILVPLIAGALVGFATFLPVIRQQDTPSAPLIVAAIIGGLVAVGVYWYGLYTLQINDAVASFQEEDSSVTREEVVEFIDEYLESEYGQTGVIGFVMDYAESGFSINRTLGSSSSGGIDIQGTVAYIFFGVEALLLIGAAVGTVVRRKNDAISKQVAANAPNA